MIFDIAQLRRIRKQLNLTQAQFAKQAHVSQSLIAKIESGNLDPTYSRVRQIIDAIERLSSKKEASIKDIMVKKIITVSADESATRIIRLITKHAISQVPVVEGKRVLGMVYEGTLLEKSVGSPLSGLKASDIMVESPPTVSEDARVSILPPLLKHYPVVLVVKGGELRGIVSKVDFLQSVA